MTEADAVPGRVSSRRDSPPAVLAALRQATGDLHRKVESLVPLLRADFDQVQFARWLNLMHPLYEVLDSVIENQDLPSRIGWRYVRRSDLITRDLSLLTEFHFAPAPAPTYLYDRLGATHRALGALYVIEGSALGGQVLHKALAKRIPMVANHGSLFLAPHGLDTKARWGEFIECLGAHTDDESAIPDVIEGASMTFAAVAERIENDFLSSDFSRGS